MAFIDIKDPQERDRIVADYISTIHRVQERNENEKAIGLARKVVLEQTFNPIVKATEKSTEAITNKMAPLHEELKKIANQRKIKNEWTEQSGLHALDFYLTMDKKKLDKYYGIYHVDDKLVMGNVEVEVDGKSNIYVDNTMYKGTPGLWNLIMIASPENYSYNEDDLEEYTKLAEQTNLSNNPLNLQELSRPLQTTKAKILKTLKEEDDKSGSGVVLFLPGDIKGLTTRLSLLLAEYHAGNKTTRNEIVVILDELKRRKQISNERYNDINKQL